jgi:hypothetical protein
MLVFIDESGDPGLKIGSGSTDYFIVMLAAQLDKRACQLAGQKGRPYEEALQHLLVLMRQG